MDRLDCVIELYNPHHCKADEAIGSYCTCKIDTRTALSCEYKYNRLLLLLLLLLLNLGNVMSTNPPSMRPSTNRSWALSSGHQHARDKVWIYMCA